MLVEFPILIAVAPEPITAIIVPLVGEPYGDAMIAIGPDFLDQTIVELSSPLAREKCFDFRSTLDKLRAIAPATVGRVGECDPGRIPRVPCVFGHSRLLRCGLGGEGGERRAIHITDLVRQLRETAHLGTEWAQRSCGPTLTLNPFLTPGIIGQSETYHLLIRS